MPSDRDMISKEEHELNYVLQKFDKRQTIENREILEDALDDFKDDESYAPHNRESFYDYLESEDVLNDLE